MLDIMKFIYWKNNFIVYRKGKKENCIFSVFGVLEIL